MASRVPCGVSELAYSPQKFVQEDIDHSYHVALTPHNTIIQGNQLIFHIEGGADFTDLANTVMECEIRIRSLADEAVATTKNITPVNNILHSMFSQVQVQLKDTIVTHASPNYGYQAYFENLLNYSKGSKDTWMTSVGWCMDEADKFDEPTNAALAKRRAWITEDKLLKLRGKLTADVSNQPLLIPSHVDVTFTLTPQRANFALQNFEQDVDYKIELVSAKLVARKVKLHPHRVAEFERHIAKAPVRLPTSQVKVTTLSIPSGLSSFTQNAVFSGELPQMIVCGLVSNSAYTGDKKKNPFNFAHVGLNHIQLKVNELLVPTYPLAPNFKEKNVQECYESLYHVVGRWGDDWSNGLTVDDYCGGSAIYGFMTSQDSLCRGDSPASLGAIDVSLKFDTALTETMTLVMYSVTQAEIVIDKFRNVLLNV